MRSIMADGEGFEPPVPFGTLAFQASTFGRSVIHPCGLQSPCAAVAGEATLPFELRGQAAPAGIEPATCLSQETELAVEGRDRTPKATRVARRFSRPVPSPTLGLLYHKLVPQVGFEPTRPFGHSLLKTARLPVPPQGHGAGSGIRTHKRAGLNCPGLPFPLSRRCWCPRRDSNPQDLAVTTLST